MLNEFSKRDQFIKVKILRKWGQPNRKKPNENFSIKMIIMDEQGNRMQANVLKRWFWRFKQYLEENACLLIKNPSLGLNNAKYKYSDNLNKICLGSETYVKKCHDFEGPEHGFFFTSFRSIKDEEVSEFTTIDVIAHVVRFFTTDKTDNKLTMEFEDLEGNTVFLTLWNKYADQMKLYVSEHLDEMDFIVIIQLGRVKFYKGNPYVSNSFGDVVSRVFINSDIDAITKYKKRLQCIFLNNIYCLIWSKDVCKDVGWNYMGCKKCTRKLLTTYEIRVKEDGSDDFEEVKVIECPKCKSQFGTEVPRFKIQIRVQDVTGVVSLTLFDRDASKLIDKSAQDLLDIYGEDNFPEEINSLLEKRFAFKASDSDSVNMSMSELPSLHQVANKDALSSTDDNLTLLSNVSQSINTAHLTVGKSSSITSRDSILKRKLDDIFDVDESPMTSSSKFVAGFIPEKPNGDVDVKLLIPKVEK
ncbi:hypothetical protein SSX86_008232 [Deinandra increscens subsp. villosa]|uniref:Replication factor A C-terminal domain-containing protein n=1 Tax=Deinandra increscens subsp. villosa TaxID=3103831 RepID=A0AAP0H1V7_9ASTR